MGAIDVGGHFESLEIYWKKQVKLGQKILKNYVSLLFGNITIRGFGIIASVYLARVLGVEGFGILGFAQSITAYFIILSGLGLQVYGVKVIAQQKELDYPKTIAQIIPLRLIGSFISYIVLFFIIIFIIKKSLFIKEIILIYGLILFPMAILIDWFFQGIQEMEKIAFAQILRQMLYVSSILLLVRSYQLLILVPILFFLSHLVESSFLLIKYKLRFYFNKFVFNPKSAKKILLISVPMCFSFFLTTIYHTVDTTMLGLLRDEIEVGWYVAAHKLIFFLVGLFAVFGRTIFPIISTSYKESIDKTKKILTMFSKLIVTIIIPLGIGLIFFGKYIVTFIYGNEYFNSVIPFQLLSLGIVALIIGIPFSFFLLSSGRQKEYLFSVLTGAIVNIAANFLLIPKYGIIGASVSTVITEIIVTMMIYNYSRRIIHVRFFKIIVKAIIASSGILAALLLPEVNVIIKISIFIILYIILNLAFGNIWANYFKILKTYIASKKNYRKM